MMRVSSAVLAILALAVAEPLHGQRAEGPGGKQVRLHLAGSMSLTGELLAVGRDSVWLLDRGGPMQVLPLSTVSKAWVSRSGFTSRQGWTWTLVGGLVTGALLTASCSSVSDECGGVGVSTLLSWVLVGGISAGISGSSMRAVEVDGLRAYARFPQGLPEAFGERHEREP